MGSRVNELFISCEPESMLRVGATLSAAIPTVTTATVSPCPRDGHRARRSRLRARHQPCGENPPPEPVVEAGKDGDQRQPVEKRQIAAGDQDDLQRQHQRAAGVAESPRAQDQKRCGQLDDVVEGDADRVRPVRQRVKVRRQRARHRLRLEVKVEAGEVAPARVAAQLDEPGAPHDPHRQPAQKPDHRARRRRDGETAGAPAADKERCRGTRSRPAAAPSRSRRTSARHCRSRSAMRREK